MPLNSTTSQMVLSYCDRDLADSAQIAIMFDFISDEKLRLRLEIEYSAARYIYKLGEALGVSDQRLHAHVKFQIVQFAAIYEAIIVHLLWGPFRDTDVIKAMETHDAFRKVASLPANLQLRTLNGDVVALCVLSPEKTPKNSIKFDDKVNAAVTIGFLDRNIGEEIKGIYKWRNAVHLESAVKNDIKYEIENSLLAYRRLKPFLRGVKGFLKDGKLPPGSRAKAKK